MVFKKRFRNKRKEGNSQGDGFRKARQRGRDKEKTKLRQYLIEGKATGDREDHLVDLSPEPRSKKQHSDYDWSRISIDPPRAPKTTRTVQLGVPKGKNKFASTSDTGRTTVREDKFRKGSTESWPAYKATIRRSMTVESGGLTKKRVQKRNDRESYLASLEEILTEKLYFEIFSIVYAGTRGQGQRRRLFNRLSAGLKPTECTIVPDGGRRPVVVFAYRVAMLSGDEEELNRNWSNMFRPEYDYVMQHIRPLAAHHRTIDNSIFHSEHQGAGFSQPAQIDSTSYVDAEWARTRAEMKADTKIHVLNWFPEFMSKFGNEQGPTITSYLQEYGPMFMKMCTRFYVISRVPPENRSQCAVVLFLGDVASDPNNIALVTQVVDYVVREAAFVAMFCAAAFFSDTNERRAEDIHAPLHPLDQLFGHVLKDYLNRHAVPATHLGWDIPSFQSFIQKVREMDLSPGTVVNALVTVVTAMWTIKYARGKTGVPVAGIFSIVKGLFGGIKCESVDEAVSLLITNIPVVINSVIEAISARSLAPFFARKPGLFEDFVQVRAAYDMHKTGQYPNSAFENRDAFVRALASLRTRFNDEAQSNAMKPEVKQHLVTVNTMYNEVANDLSGQWREAPYAVAIVGGSSIGKSGLTRYIADRVSMADSGVRLKNSDIYTQQPTDKYASGYDMSKRVVILDDLCNQKATQGSSLATIPTAIIIDVINNVMVPTNQAELSNKGRIFWNPRLVIATSNVLKLDANLHSNEPVSILRRFNWFIEPVVREEYRVQGGTGLDPNKIGQDVIMPDAWTFEVYRWIPAEGADRMRKVRCPGLKNGCSVFDLLDFLEKDSRKYYAIQRELTATVDTREHLDYDIATLRAMAGAEETKKGEPGDYSKRVFKRKFRNKRKENEHRDEARPAEHMMYSESFEGVEDCVLFDEEEKQSEPDETFSEMEPLDAGLFSDVSASNPVNYAYEGRGEVTFDDWSIPGASHDDYVRLRAQPIISKLKEQHRRRVRWEQRWLDMRKYVDPVKKWFVSVAEGVVKHTNSEVSILLLCLCIVMVYPICLVPLVVFTTVLLRFFQVSVKQTANVAVRTSSLAVVIGFIAWVALRRDKREREVRVNPQGIAEFATQDDSNVVQGGPQPDNAPESSTLDNLANHVSKNLIYATALAGEASSARTTLAVITPLKTNLYVANYHTIAPVLEAAKHTGEIQFIFTRCTGTPQTHVIPLTNIWWKGYTESDTVFISWKGPKEVDVTSYLLPHDFLRAMGGGHSLSIRSSSLHLLRAPQECKREALDVSGRLQIIRARTFGAPALIKCQFTNDTVLKMIGTRCTVDTEPGDCGSPYFLRTKQGGTGGSYFAGIMSGRVTSGPDNNVVIAPVTDIMVQEAEQAFASRSLVSEHLGCKPALFGMPKGARLSPDRRHPELPGVTTDTEVPGVTPLGVITDERGVNMSSKNTFRSKLRYSPFCDLEPVTEHLGRVAHKTPPDPTSMRHFQAVISRMAREDVVQTEAELKAAIDLQGQLEELVRDTGKGTTPLTLFEAINGKGDITAYPMDTSPGFGFKGRKLDFFEEACMRETCDCNKYHPIANGDTVVPGREVNYYPRPELLYQIYDLRERLLAGETDLAIFRAALKDEPVERTKTKVRVFFVGMMSWNLVMRQLYAPLLSIVKSDRLRSECAVGLDPMSSGWSELKEFLDAFDEELRLAGDYSNYDNSIHSRLIRIAYQIMECLGRVVGYSDVDLRLMAAIGRNMEHPIYIILGAVFRVDGTNPSGIVITTWVNSIVNSLVHRIAFYEKNPDVSPEINSDGLYPFQMCVRLMTYGDDVLGAIRRILGINPINNHDVRRAAERLGMVFGPIDKGTERFPEYYRASEVSFLKCTSAFIPELNRHVGMVAQLSVRKCLTFERNSDMEARRNTAESALRLFYARAISEDRRSQFDEIRDALLETLVPGVEHSIHRDTLLPTLDSITEGLQVPEKSEPDKPFERMWYVE